FSLPGRHWSRSACPGPSWIASGFAATIVSTARSMSPIPGRKLGSLKIPWSIATSRQRPSAASKRFNRAVALIARSPGPPAVGRAATSNRSQPFLVPIDAPAHDVEEQGLHLRGDRPRRLAPHRPVIELADRRDLDRRAGEERLVRDVDLVARDAF